METSVQWEDVQRVSARHIFEQSHLEDSVEISSTGEGNFFLLACNAWHTTSEICLANRHVCQASCTSQCNQKSELMERATQFTYTLQHPHSRVTGEEKVNAWTQTGEKKVNTWTQTGEEKVNTWTQRGATAILQ
jgi:hypothetical protein